MATKTLLTLALTLGFASFLLGTENPFLTATQSPLAMLDALEPGAVALTSQDSIGEQQYRIERSFDLQHWSAIGSVQLDARETIEIEDTQAIGSSQAYYRAVRIASSETDPTDEKTDSAPQSSNSARENIPLVVVDQADSPEPIFTKKTVESVVLSLRLAPVVTKFYEVPESFATMIRDQEAANAKDLLAKHGIAWPHGTSVSYDGERTLTVRSAATHLKPIDAFVAGLHKDMEQHVEIEVVVLDVSYEDLATLLEYTATKTGDGKGVASLGAELSYGSDGTPTRATFKKVR